MDDDRDQAPRFRTRLSHAGRAGTKVHGFVNPPLTRGSTVLYPSVEARRAAGPRGMEQALIYGVCGTPTHWALEDAIAEIEGGTRCQLVSSGLAAVTLALQAYLPAGTHCLVPDSCYGPTRTWCEHLRAMYGIDTTYYDPELDEAGLAALMRDNTRVVFIESPGSHTFEVQDVAALARAAHAGGAKVLMDNTWGIHFFQPFRHGVDVSIQALTKYVGGHSDVLLGSITTNSDEDWHTVRHNALVSGHFASPDDCWMALRGVRTLGVRLAAQMESGLRIAAWLRARPEVAEVLHPALPGARGHALWRRDFTGACSLFGFVLRADYTVADSHRMIDALQLFGIGASWGGFESLVLPTTGFIRRSAGTGTFDGPSIRLHVGLEDTDDLIADLEQAFVALKERPGAPPHRSASRPDPAGA